MLAKGSSVMSAALEAGLSGPSRLHDLCLKVEAMTPGRYATGGAGVSIVYGFRPSLFGTALIMATERGLCGLAFGATMKRSSCSDMRSRWPNAAFVANDEATAIYAARIFANDSSARRFPLAIELFATPW